MSAPQVSTGISFTFATSGFTANFIDVTPPNKSREALNVSHMLTTGYHKYIAAKLIEGGSLSATIQYDAGQEPPLDEDPEVITITYADGSTEDFVGFMTAESPAAALETVMTADVTFKVADDINYTPAGGASPS